MKKKPVNNVVTVSKLNYYTVTSNPSLILKNKPQGLLMSSLIGRSNTVLFLVFVGVAEGKVKV